MASGLLESELGTRRDTEEITELGNSKAADELGTRAASPIRLDLLISVRATIFVVPTSSFM